MSHAYLSPSFDPEQTCEHVRARADRSVAAPHVPILIHGSSDPLTASILIVALRLTGTFRTTAAAALAKWVKVPLGHAVGVLAMRLLWWADSASFDLSDVSSAAVLDTLAYTSGNTKYSIHMVRLCNCRTPSAKGRERSSLTSRPSNQERTSPITS